MNLAALEDDRTAGGRGSAPDTTCASFTVPVALPLIPASALAKGRTQTLVSIMLPAAHLESRPLISSFSRGMPMGTWLAALHGQL